VNENIAEKLLSPLEVFDRDLRAMFQIHLFEYGRYMIPNSSVRKKKLPCDL
jgi:hypothetical protein